MTDWRDRSIADLYCLLTALEQSGGEPLIQGLINRVPRPTDVPNARVTLRSIQKLLEQTGGSTVLPDEVARQLNTPEPIPTPVQPSTSHQHAHAIMGTNFFGIEEATKHFRVNPSPEQRITLAEIPFSPEVLEACKGTHILAAVFPLSILDIREKAPQGFSSKNWYNAEAFAADKGEIGWYLVRKTPVPRSTSKIWEKQQTLLSQDDEVPTAQVMTYMIIGHYLATGKRLFAKVYVRTSSLDSDGYRVSVGGFGSRGLDVSLFSFDDHRYGFLGVASARKHRK